MARSLVEHDLERLGRSGATAAIRRFLAAAARGETDSPPRLQVPLRSRTLVFTVGSDLERALAGFRVYSIPRASRDDAAPSQMLGLLDAATGQIVATAVGDAFGAWRTAAIGAVALEEATAPRPRSLDVAILGVGFQAHHHARAWAATGRVARFRVHARSAERSASFAHELTVETGVPATHAGSAREAIQGATAVLCATTSTTPVFEAEDLGADAYVATVGPKFGGTNEVPGEVYERAAFAFTDAPAQVCEYEATRGPLPGGRRARSLVGLADIVAGTQACPHAGLRLFVSEGLSGTEVALLAALVDSRGRPLTNLRAARLEDAPRIAALASAVWVGTYATEGVTSTIAEYVLGEFTPERIERQLGHPGRHAWIAEDGAGVVGYADLQLDQATPELGSVRQAEVLHVYVHERHTRRGVGSRLLRACCDHAFDAGCEAVWLTVWSENARAHRFYENSGWDWCGDTEFRLGGVAHANRVYALRRSTRASRGLP
jgi:ornithine cyclodeaminase/alanine dehydrogenase